MGIIKGIFNIDRMSLPYRFLSIIKAKGIARHNEMYVAINATIIEVRVACRRWLK